LRDHQQKFKRKSEPRVTSKERVRGARGAAKWLCFVSKAVTLVSRSAASKR